jgi:hypothetical protein
MRRRNERDGGAGRPTTRSAGMLPLVAAVTSALALTGAAFYTVDRVACGDPGQYVQHDNRVELVGGCVNPSDLSDVPVGPAHNSVGNSNYRP